VDPSRIADPEIAAESERERLTQLAARFSREDLMRSFDVISRAEYEIRGAAQPRFHLEMALLRWMHMRKLVPLTELLQGAGLRTPDSGPLPKPKAQSPEPTAQSPQYKGPGPGPGAQSPEPARRPPVEPSSHREAFLDEIKRSKIFFYNTVVAQAQKIDFGPDRVTFTFLPAHRTLREQLEQNRQWLESLAGVVSGGKMLVVAAQQEAPVQPAPPPAPAGSVAAPHKPADLKASAMGDAAVQAMLDVFPAEIEDVEEI
jgi:DNA polymerase-3 subunit gamma/tau